MSRFALAPVFAAAAAARPPQPYPGPYRKSLVKDVIPSVEKTCRMIADKDNRAIAGLSMGGGHTVMATNNYLSECSAPGRAPWTRPTSSNWKR
jgi:hypothetical protein